VDVTALMKREKMRDLSINRRSMNRYWGELGMVGLLLTVILLCGACGYRLRSSTGKLPQGIQSIGIPTFKNRTTQFKIEQILSIAVLKEFSLRTQIQVNSNESNVDSVLVGEIRNISSTPVTFGTQTIGSQTFGSTLMITVEIAVKLMRSSDSSVIWENERYIFREQHVLNANIKDFFSEENPALERLARSFAASLASTILERSPL
jgi:outer membrane lipopolysaccharide assembly protein LptE/RlpB